jgi:hypothetical protein
MLFPIEHSAAVDISGKSSGGQLLEPCELNRSVTQSKMRNPNGRQMTHDNGISHEMNNLSPRKRRRNVVERPRKSSDRFSPFQTAYVGID